MPGGAADRDDGVQDPAGPLGQGPDPDQQESAAQDLPLQRAPAGEGGGGLSPDGQYQLSADDRNDGTADPLHDRALLPGVVPDAADRRAAVHGLELVDRGVLPVEPAGAVPQDLDEDLSVPAVSDGAGDRADGDQLQGGDGSAVRDQERVRADAQVPGGEEGREVARGEIPQAPQTDALD